MSVSMYACMHICMGRSVCLAETNSLNILKLQLPSKFFYRFQRFIHLVNYAYCTNSVIKLAEIYFTKRVFVVNSSKFATTKLTSVWYVILKLYQ